MHNTFNQSQQRWLDNTCFSYIHDDRPLNSQACPSSSNGRNCGWSQDRQFCLYKWSAHTFYPRSTSSTQSQACSSLVCCRIPTTEWSSSMNLIMLMRSSTAHFWWPRTVTTAKKKLQSENVTPETTPAWLTTVITHLCFGNGQLVVPWKSGWTEGCRLHCGPFFICLLHRR